VRESTQVNDTHSLGVIIRPEVSVSSPNDVLLIQFARAVFLPELMLFIYRESIDDGFLLKGQHIVGYILAVTFNLFDPCSSCGNSLILIKTER